MTDEDRAAIKTLFPEHAFLRIMHPLGEAILAVPRVQDTQEKTDAVALWHGASVRLGGDGRKAGLESQEVECAKDGTLERAPLPLSAS